jgi:hypothetical protein
MIVEAAERVIGGLRNANRLRLPTRNRLFNLNHRLTVGLEADRNSSIHVN